MHRKPQPRRKRPTKEQLRAEAELAFKSAPVRKIPEALRPESLKSNMREHHKAQARARGLRV
jgi:hypothetical protein